METQLYTGVLAEIIEALADVGDVPSVRAIRITQEEMNEIVNSGAFRTTVSKYYGDAIAPVYNNIITDTQGNVLSLYLGSVLIAVGPEEPSGPIADLVYEPLVVNPNGSTTFTKGSDLIVGTGNPASGMTVGSNANIELALAARKASDITSYNNGTGRFNIPLEDNQNWNFTVSVGSKNAEIPNVLDMYNVKLCLDLNSNVGQTTYLVWDLKFVDGYIRGNPVKNFVWYAGVDPVITDAATTEDLNVTQTIQRYSFQFISKYLPSYVERNGAGAPLGEFTLRLEATPKSGDTGPVFIEILANTSKKM